MFANKLYVDQTQIVSRKTMLLYVTVAQDMEATLLMAMWVVVHYPRHAPSVLSVQLTLIAMVAIANLHALLPMNAAWTKFAQIANA